MTESTSATAVQNLESTRRFRNPLNPPIEFLARRYGGTRPKELERFLKFACVGVSGAIIDLGSLTVMQATFLPPARKLTTPLLDVIHYNPGLVVAQSLVFNVAAATTIAFLLAVISNFIWTSLWVYPDSRTRTLRRQLIQFTFISVVGWTGRTLWITTMYQVVGHAITPLLVPFVHLFSPTFEATPVTEDKVGTLVAQLIAMGVVMIWNFFANRYWTFNDVD